MTTKDRTKLIQRLRDYIIGLGAVESDGDSTYEWYLQTPIGELGISFHETVISNVVTIFCRFNPRCGAPPPILAMKRFPNEVNQNGKWNFHFDRKSCTVNTVYATFVADIERTRDAKSIALAMAGWTNTKPLVG